MRRNDVMDAKLRRPENKSLRQISPYVRLAHHFRCPREFSLPRRRINDHALLYFKRGQGEFSIGRESWAIAPGTLFIVRPDVVHSFDRAESGPYEMLNLHFDLVERTGCEKIHYQRNLKTANPRQNLERLETNSKSPDHLPWQMKIHQMAAYERLFFTIHNLVSLRDTASRLWLKAAFVELLSLLYRQVRARAVSPQLLQHLPQLERAVRFMGATLDRPLTLTELAREAALSRSYFATSFAAYYQISPARFHLRQRIESSAMELIFGPRSIKEIAEAFGFQTVHHFSRCFRQLMGMPPAAYRQVHGPSMPLSKDE